MATLIELLEQAASDVMLVYSRSDAENRERAARLRDAARRLREEMAPLYRPELKGQLALVRVALERINGGPSTAESGVDGIVINQFHDRTKL